MNLATHFHFSTLIKRSVLLVLAATFSVALPAQTKPRKDERRELKLEASEATGAKPRKDERRGQKIENSDAGGAKNNADDPQSRLLTKFREQLEVADDAEWDIISERITRVADLRREISSGSGAFRGGLATRAVKSARPEQDALRIAVTDKLPDAEIKSRLARAHEVYLQNEAKLSKAQEELRAVLTVRQEAVVVMAGLLPP